MQGTGSGGRALPRPGTDTDAEAAELLPFLRPGARIDLQAAATHHVLALTGGASGRSLLARQEALLRALAELAAAPVPAPSRDATRALVNLTADPGLHDLLLAADPELPGRLLALALDPLWPWAEEAAAALANLSREPAPCTAVIGKLAAAEPGRLGLEQLVHALCMPDYNAGAPLHYLGPLLSNLSQRAEVRCPATAASYPVHRFFSAQGRGGGDTSELLLRASTSRMVAWTSGRHSPFLATAFSWA